MKGQGEEEEEQKWGRKKTHSLDDSPGVLGFWISPLGVLSQDETPCGGPESASPKHTHAHAHSFSHWQLQPGMGCVRDPCQ